MKRFSRLLVATVLLSAGLHGQQDQAAMERLKSDLMCNCGCPHQLGQCGDECGVAPQLIAEVEGLLAERSVAEVFDAMAARYGRAIFAAPPAEGWGWLAWLLPVIGVLFGALLVWGFLQNARREAPATAPLSPEDDRRYRAILQRELHRD